MEATNKSSPSLRSDMGMRGIEKVVTYLWVVAIIALISNIASLLILYRNPKLRKNRYYRLVICLSISDAIMSLTLFLVLLRAMFIELERTWTCLGFQTVMRICTVQSFFQTLLIAIERCIVSSTDSYKYLCSVHSQTAIMLTTWIISAIYCGIFAAIFGDPTVTSCDLEILYKGNYEAISNSNRICYMVFLFTIFVLYIITIKRIQKSSRSVRPPPIIRPSNSITMEGHAPQHSLPSTSKPAKNNPVTRDANLKPVFIHNTETNQGECAKEEEEHGSHIQSTSARRENPDTSAHKGASIEPVPHVSGTDVHGQTINRATPDADRRENVRRDIKSWHFQCQLTAGIIIVILTVTYMPGIVDMFLKLCYDTYKQPRGFAIVMTSLPLVNLCINPLIYLWRIRRFRHAVLCKKTYVL